MQNRESRSRCSGSFVFGVRGVLGIVKRRPKSDKKTLQKKTRQKDRAKTDFLQKSAKMEPKMDSDLDHEFSPWGPRAPKRSPRAPKRSPRVPKGCQKIPKRPKKEPKGYQKSVKSEPKRYENCHLTDHGLCHFVQNNGAT